MSRNATLAAVFGLILLLPAGVHRPPAGTGSAPAATPAESQHVATAPASAVAVPAAALAADSAAADTSAADSLAVAAPPAPRDYVAEARADFTPEDQAYAGTRVVLAFLDPALVILLMLLLLFSGLSARMRDIAHQLGHRRYVRALVYLFLFILAVFLIGLPVDWYAGYALEHQYGLSNQSFGGWLLDDLKGQAVTLVVLGVIPLVALGYRAIAKYPRTWWLWIAAGSVPLILASVLLSPLVYDTLFNKFTPLPDAKLSGEILHLAARAGIPARQVFEADKSRQTNKYNAYVSGFGATQRIVIWDTTLKGMSDDEILFVVGHEMGHYRLHHIWTGMAFTIVLIFAGCFALRGLVTWLYRLLAEHCHLRSLDDVATMPVFVIAITILSFVVQPAANAFSRRIEHEADGFAIEVTRDNDAGARAFLALGSQNRSDPDPPAIVKFWLYTHPPLADRIQFALDYRPWEKGEPDRWFHPGR